MITLLGGNAIFCDGISRGSCLKAGVLSAAGLTLADVLQLQSRADESGRASHRPAVISVELAWRTHSVRDLRPETRRSRRIPGHIRSGSDELSWRDLQRTDAEKGADCRQTRGYPVGPPEQQQP